MTSEPSMQEFVDAAQEILGNLLRLLQLEGTLPSPTVEDGQIFFQIETEDAGRIIGRASQTLDAIQFILNRMMSRRFEDSPYCVVDAGHYREQRREKLLDDASAALERVRQTGCPWRMPLLNSMERRIIHQALKNCPDITTHSEDEEADGRKRVVISLSPDFVPPPSADVVAPAESNDAIPPPPPGNETLPPPPADPSL